MSLTVVDAGPLVTVQDLGRVGFQRFGVPTSGAMDGLAIRVANELVCNSWNAACLEIGLGGLVITTTDPSVIAVTGRGVDLVIGGHTLRTWSSVFVRAGTKIEVMRRDWGWVYLAIAGGIDVPPVLGSRSTYLRGSFGGVAGRALQPGDILPVGHSPFGAEIAGREMPPSIYADELTADVILGPQVDRFAEDGLRTFLAGEYTVSLESDRMGYRLSGETIAHNHGADILSDGMVFGAVQVPSNGQPIVMMSDHATTGGYTKIATVTTLDTWRIVQCQPGKGKIRFSTTDVSTAQQKYREVVGNLRAQIRDPRDGASYTW
jgi:antagonist of KipI